MYTVSKLVALLPQKLLDREMIVYVKIGNLMKTILILLFSCATLAHLSATPTDDKDFYQSPVVKKMGIKAPPRNRLKTDLSRPASEQELAKFLNDQSVKHKEHVNPTFHVRMKNLRIS